MSTRADQTMPVDPEVAFQLEGVEDAALRLYPEAERPIYYDPDAAGRVGPHLRVPGRRSWLTFQRGRIRPANGLEEQVVRKHLGARADRLKGDTLLGQDGEIEYLHCSCGLTTGNMIVAAAHRRRFPDHDMEF